MREEILVIVMPENRISPSRVLAEEGIWVIFTMHASEKCDRASCLRAWSTHYKSETQKVITNTDLRAVHVHA